MPLPHAPRLYALLLALVSAGVGASPEWPPRMDERVAACAGCHGEGGRSAAESYYPSIAGKPAGYLYNQLRHFRDGRRQHRVMADMLAPLSADYLWHIAQYYAAQPPVRAAAAAGAGAAAEAGARGRAPQDLDEAATAAARRLVRQGDPARNLAACADCHGPALQGAQPAVPGLRGLRAEYLAAQLGAWRAGVRQAAAPDCMAHVAQALRPDEIVALSRWIAAQPPGGAPLAHTPQRVVADCGAAQPERPAAPPTQAASVPAADATPAERGAYLVRAGNCLGCHTAQGGAALAGGRPIQTPFGSVYSSNLTPDPQTGLGAWSANDFWRALSAGISRDGRLLSPAFPYPHYRHLRRADADAMWAWLQAQPPVVQQRPAHTLRWPFGTQLALRAWRWLYLDDEPLPTETERSAAWQRGRYLVEALGHCNACHGPRNALGAAQASRAFAGAMLPDQRWYAPPLTQSAPRDAQDRADLITLLQHGSSARRVATGPMAAVVSDSLQHLARADLAAMVDYLDSLPAVSATARPALRLPAARARKLRQQGKALYAQHCADCHGAQGAGEAGVYPPLAGNALLTDAHPGNAIRTLRFGGYPPSTTGQPYPFGMPAYAHRLSAQQIAAVLSYARAAWGNAATAVSPEQVGR